MRAKLCTLLAIFTLTLASSITAFAAPEVMPDGGLFDAEYYAQNNPDVVAAFGTDKELLYSHYVNCGRAEGRQGLSAEDALLVLPFISKEKVIEYNTNGYNLNQMDYTIYLASALRYGLGEEVRHPCGRTFKNLYQMEKATWNEYYIENGYENPFETFETYMAFCVNNESAMIMVDSLSDLHSVLAIKAQAGVKDVYKAYQNLDVSMDTVKDYIMDCQTMLSYHYGAVIEELKISETHERISFMEIGEVNGYRIECKLKYVQ